MYSDTLPITEIMRMFWLGAPALSCPSLARYKPKHSGAQHRRTFTMWRKAAAALLRAAKPTTPPTNSLHLTELMEAGMAEINPDVQRTS